jgi:hypothetical protein
MKRLALFFLVPALLFAALSGCAPGAAASSAEASSLAQANPGRTAVAASEQALEDYLAGMQVYDAFDYDFDKDGTPERIVLAVEAERARNGEILLDDGQPWALCVEMDGRCYPVYPKSYVQLGMLEYALFEDVSQRPALLIQCVQGAGIQIWECAYDPDAQGFEIAEVYMTGAINLLHTV